MPEANHNVPPSVLRAFDFPSRTRLVLGVGCVERVGDLAREMGANNVLLVTDAGIVAAGHAGRVQRYLEVAGLRVTMFDRGKENPTTKCVDDCVDVARGAGVDGLVGLVVMHGPDGRPCQTERQRNHQRHANQAATELAGHDYFAGVPNTSTST